MNEWPALQDLELVSITCKARDFPLDPIWTDGTMLLKDTLKDAKGISSPRVFSSLFTLCQPLREVASVVGTSIKRLWLQNAKQQDAAGDPISVLNALQGKKLRSLSTMAGKSGKCSQGANKLERGLY